MADIGSGASRIARTTRQQVQVHNCVRLSVPRVDPICSVSMSESSEEQEERMPKISGMPHRELQGLKICAKLHKAKRNGKDRIWIHIWQAKPKRWRIAAALSYVNARMFDLKEASKSESVSYGEARFG